MHSWGEAMQELYEEFPELWDIPPMVCTEHYRFVPCRKAGEHVFSEDPWDVTAVREYHERAEETEQADREADCGG